MSLESAIAGHEVGSVDFLTLMDNLITLLNYQLSYYEQVSNVERAVAQLEPLVGVSLRASSPSTGGTGIMIHESKKEDEARGLIEEEAVNQQLDTDAQILEAKAAEAQIVGSKAAPRKSRRIFALVLSLILVAVVGLLNRNAFLQSGSEQPAPNGERKILYWVDPCAHL